MPECNDYTGCSCTGPCKSSRTQLVCPECGSDELVCAFKVWATAGGKWYRRGNGTTDFDPDGWTKYGDQETDDSAYCQVCFWEGPPDSLVKKGT